MHDTSGGFLGLLADYSLQNFDPQGIWPLTGTDFLVAINGTDMIERRNIFGEKVSDIIDSNFTGNVYGLTVRNQEVFVIESNTVESFYLNGTRIGNARINATVGSCVLNTPRGITVNSAGYILTVATGNDRINVYDVSDSSSTTCVSTNTTLGAIDPIAIIAHSNGKLYVATQGDDAIYEFAGDGTGSGTKIYQPGVATLNNPTALLEMPDGSILIASDGTNNILQIDTAGNPIAVPFMQNAFTGLVLQMALMPGGGE